MAIFKYDVSWHQYSSLSWRRTWLVLTAVALVFVVTTLTPLRRSAALVIPTKSDHVPDIFNRTLGFQRVFAIGLPSRPDKHDALSLASSYSDFDIEIFPGVTPEDISEKAIPEKWPAEWPPSAFASKRAHLNLLRKIVDECIQTTLILEDDIDWDINLKQQLSHFATGVQHLTGTKGGPESPYGSGWDLLWPGHCRTGVSDDTAPLYILSNDTTVPPTNHRRAKWRNAHIVPELLSNTTRIIYKANAGMCTMAYAITFEAARKTLGALSLRSDTNIYDNAMSRMCAQKFGVPFSCYSVYPPFISSHRFAGSTARDSDLQSLDATKKHAEYTWEVVYSVIQNIPRLAAGKQTVLSQWPKDTVEAERRVDEPYAVVPSFREVAWSTMEKETVVGINDFPVPT